jgi:DNA topoisomerase-1
LETAERVSGERFLGDHPETGERVIVRMGKFGPMAQIGVTDETNLGKKPRYARLRKGQTIETIDLAEALELFRLPRLLGEFENLPVKVNLGRFGPYVQHGTAFISLKPEDDLFTIDLEATIQRIVDKRDEDAKKLILDFPEHGVQVLNGRWGPFIKHGKDNYKIPKTEDAEALTIETILEIMKTPPPKKSGKFTKRK